VRDIALVCLADGIVGISFGAISVAGGLPLWVPVVMSLVVFAGGAQFSAVGVALAGGSPLAAATAGLLVNARHVPFGFAVADVLGKFRFPGAHLIIDESVAFALGESDPARRRAAFWTCGFGMFVVWNACVLTGALAGRAIGNTDALGLDSAYPAVLLALVFPSLGDRKIRRAAVLGAAIALAATPVLPPGMPELAALAGVVLA